MPFDGSTLIAATTGTFVGSVFTDSFTVFGADVDMIRLELTAGSTYTVDVDNGVSGDLALRIFDQFGAEVEANDDGFFANDDVVLSLSPYIAFVPGFSGIYYVAVAPYYLRNYNPATTAGRFSPENPLPAMNATLIVTTVSSSAWPGGSTISITAEGVSDETDVLRDDDGQVRVAYSGALEFSQDVDVGRVDLVKGDLIVVDVNGMFGVGTVLRIFDSAGVQIGFDDDSGTLEDPELIFAAPSAGSYYLGISGEGNAGYSPFTGTGTANGSTGEYEIIVHRNPTYLGSSSVQDLIGTDAAEYIVTLAGNDTVSAGSGGDTVSGGDDADSLIGGLGNDVLYGDAGTDTLSGSQGNDMLSGGGGDDLLNGSIGTDVLDGGTGNDTLLGRENADTLYGGAGVDVLAGGDGDDVSFGGAESDQFTDTQGNDTMAGDAGTDSLFGGIGDDLLDGGSDADTLGGGDGIDTLLGGTGADSLAGGPGNDRLIGGAGNDTLRGVGGDDDFVFLSTAADGLDLILDFALAANDRIDLSAIFAATGSVVTGANLAQFVQVLPAGAGTDAFLGIDADGATGGLSFTAVAQVVAVTPAQLFDANNFIL